MIGRETLHFGGQHGGPHQSPVAAVLTFKTRYIVYRYVVRAAFAASTPYACGYTRFVLMIFSSGACACLYDFVFFFLSFFAKFSPLHFNFNFNFNSIRRRFKSKSKYSTFIHTRTHARASATLELAHSRRISCTRHTLPLPTCDE